MQPLNCLTSLVFLFLTSPFLNGQVIPSKKVVFPPGKDSASIRSSIKGDKIIDYKLTVQQGQVLSVKLKTNNGANYFNILPPGSNDVAIYNSSIDGNVYSGSPEKSGEYSIRVYLMRSAARRNESANYTISFSISAGKKPS